MFLSDGFVKIFFHFCLFLFYRISNFVWKEQKNSLILQKQKRNDQKTIT